jgi:DUF4097 and DUF4098 domain-containing protein YvlB
MRTLSLFLVTFCLFTATVSAYEETRQLRLETSGISLLDIDSGAGFLRIKGDTSAQAITVTAEITITKIDDAKAKKNLEDLVNLSLERHGDKAVLVSKQGKELRSLFSFGDDVQVRIDLTVVTPEAMNLAVDDGSGEIDIADIAGRVSVMDGSGEITVRRISGAVDINDGSGEITLDGISGNVRIDDGSGSIDIRQVAGDVKIDDGSGSMDIVRINGSVTVSDGSGSITITDVERNVTITEEGSGGVSVSNVKGTVKRPNS